MASRADLSVLVQGLLGGGENLVQGMKARNAPEKVATVIDLQQRQAQIKEAEQKLKLLKKQTDIALNEEERNRLREEGRRNAIEAMRADPNRRWIADLMEAAPGMQLSGDVQSKAAGVTGPAFDIGGESLLTADSKNWLLAKLRGEFKGGLSDWLGYAAGQKRGPARMTFTPEATARLEKQYREDVAKYEEYQKLSKEAPGATKLSAAPPKPASTFEDYLAQRLKVVLKQAELVTDEELPSMAGADSTLTGGLGLSPEAAALLDELAKRAAESLFEPAE